MKFSFHGAQMLEIIEGETELVLEAICIGASSMLKPITLSLHTQTACVRCLVHQPQTANGFPFDIGQCLLIGFGRMN